MRDQGYQVDAVSGLNYDKASTTNYYRLPTPYVTYDAYVRFAGWQLADLALFRHSPHVLKPWVYNDQAWRLQTTFGQSVDTPGRRYLPVNGQAFLADYTKKNARSGMTAPIQYLHTAFRLAGVVEAIAIHRARSIGAGITLVMRFADRGSALSHTLLDWVLRQPSSAFLDHGVALPPERFKRWRCFGGPAVQIARIALALLG